MFKSGEEVISYIEAIHVKSDFERVQALFAKHGNFQNNLKCIHVAGTDGKGSTVSYLAAVLMKRGYKVGTFTSPHLEIYNDRIRINNQYIKDDELLQIANKFYDDIVNKSYSFFEIVTFIGLYYLYINKVDYAVIEVGMGGRLDATNVITPLISVITNIGYDHMAILGNSLEQIAFEKAGIIKTNVPVVIGCNMEASAEQTIDQVAKKNNAPLIKAHQPGNLRLEEGLLRFCLDNKEYQTKCAALYQSENASTAITVLQYLRQEQILLLDQASISQGIKKATWWGRFEKMKNHPAVYIDGAHNIHGITALAETLTEIKRQRFNIKIIFAALADKEPIKMLTKLLEVTNQIAVTDFDFYRCQDSESLAKGFAVTIDKDWRHLINAVVAGSGEKDFIVVTGSLFFISRVRPYMIKMWGD